MEWNFRDGNSEFVGFNRQKQQRQIALVHINETTRPGKPRNHFTS